MNFTYQSFPNTVYFGGDLFQHIEKASAGKTFNTFTIAEPRFEAIANRLSALPHFEVVGRISEIAQHVPIELVNKVKLSLEGKSLDLIISIGGGSSIGLAKALALQFPVKIWAIPSTYAGSEMTNIYGISQNGEKLVGRDDRVLPEKVFYAPELTQTLPVTLATTSAVNALAHLIEALYADNTNPVTYQLALKGSEYILNGLEDLARTKTLSANTNEQLLAGAYLAGKCLCEVNTSLHHKAAHVLGGSFGMDHSKVHTVLLIYVLQYQWSDLDAELRSDLIRIFNHHCPAQKLKDLVEKSGSTSTLKSIGFKSEDIEKAAHMIGSKKFANPAPYDVNSIKKLLQYAYEGLIL